MMKMYALNDKLKILKYFVIVLIVDLWVQTIIMWVIINYLGVEYYNSFFTIFLTYILYIEYTIFIN